MNLLFAVMALALVAGCNGSEKREAAHLDRGVAFFQAGNFIKARLEFRNVLKINPHNVKARYHLALVEEEEGNRAQAFANFIRASEADPDHLPSLIKIGQYYLFDNQLDKALMQSERILELEPGSADGHALRGAVLLRRDELPLAREAIERALSVNPAHVAAVAAMVGLERQEGSLEAAMTILSRAIEEHPDEDGLLLLRAELLIEQKALSDAEGVYRALIQKDPANLSHQTNLAKLIIRQGRKDDADAYLRSIVEAQPHRAETILLLADFLFNQRGFAEAEAAFLGFVEQYPTEFAYRYALADLYLKHNDLANAIVAYRQIIELNASPDKAPVHNLLGELYRAIGNNASAEAEFRVAIQHRPEFTPAYNNLAGMFLQSGNIREAITIYRNGLAAIPGDEKLSFGLANALILDHNFPAAITTYESMLAHNPDLPSVANNLAALIADYQYQDVAQLERALKLVEPLGSTENPFFLDTLGWVHFRAGNFEQALGYLERSITKVPEAPQLHYHLGMIYNALGQTEMAERALKQALVDGAEYPGLQDARMTLEAL